MWHRLLSMENLHNKGSSFRWSENPPRNFRQGHFCLCPVREAYLILFTPFLFHTHQYSVIQCTQLFGCKTSRIRGLSHKLKVWLVQVHHYFYIYVQLTLLTIFSTLVSVLLIQRKYNATQRATKFKKVQAKKIVKSNKSNLFFVKLHFWRF